MTRREFLAVAAAAGDLRSDPDRPRFHFLPPANWMNDPNGPIWFDGRYHLFYQYNPNGAFWGTMHWGHASSVDLVHWKHLPVALAPEPGGPDKDGVFTGCAVVRNGVPTLIYTGVSPEVQCIATSGREMLVWKKHSGNPVIAGPPPGMKVTGFRDPCVWQEGDSWYMLVGSGIKGAGGMALLYRSPDLVRWTYLNPLFNADAGDMWECPDFFPLGGKYVFYASTQRTTRYWIGRYSDHRFTPESEGILDSGAYYAPKSFLGPRNRRIVWGWVQERRSAEAQKAAGWSGTMSLPRVLTIRQDGRLGIEPAAEIRSLRGRPSPPLAASAEIEAVMDPVACRLRLTDRLSVAFDPGQALLSIAADGRTSSGKFSPPNGEPLRLHVFLDGSVVELYANGIACITGRLYGAAALRLSPSLEGGKLRSLRTWAL